MEKKEGENGIQFPDPETRRIREAYRRLELDPVTGRSIRKGGTFKLSGWSSKPGPNSSSIPNDATRKRKSTAPEATQEPGPMQWESALDQGQQKPRLDEVTSHPQPVEPSCPHAENGGETAVEVEIPEVPRESIFSILTNFGNNNGIIGNSFPFPPTVVDATLTKGIAKMNIDAP